MMVFTKKIQSFQIKRAINRGAIFLKKRLGNLSLPDKIILTGSIIAFISLFMKWIYFEDMSHNSFHTLTGANGYLLFILIIGLISSILSLHYKQKLKLYSGLSFNDYHLAIVVGILLIILPINSLVFIQGLSTLSESVHGNGIGLSITSGILVFVGAILKKKEINSGDMSLYMSPEQSENLIPTDQKTRDNMKLPF